jgi:predicted amidohydrolase YtcJ
VLSEDLFTVDPEKIKDIEIVSTVVGGASVYQA